MNGNALNRVKNCSEIDALSIAYYLYQLCQEMDEYESHEEIQHLFNSLVSRLGLESHYRNVLDKLLAKAEKQKLLNRDYIGEHHHHPFDTRKRLSVFYREDNSCYESCGSWDTDTEENVNLVRYMFCSRKTEFAKLVALVFFTEPGKFEDEESKLPATVNVSAKVKKTIKDLSSVQFAIDTLKLSKEEGELLQVAFRMQSVKELYDVCNDLYRSDTMPRFAMYSKCSGKTQKEIRMLLKKDQKLVSYGLMDTDGDMDSDAVDAITDKDMKIYFSDLIKNEKALSTYEPESFSVKKEKTDLAIQFLKSSNACNILLYGAPGAGKTEYAKMLVKQAGLKMCSYKNEIEVASKDGVDTNRDSADVALSRLNCYLSLKKDDSILVVDEAETVLKTIGSFFGMKFSLPQKGTVNRMLENSENKVIWLLNYTDELDESTLRRFTYSIRFHEMPKSTLRSIAEKKFKEVNLKQELQSEILDMCGKFQVTGASVDNIVKAVKSMDCENNDSEKVIKDVRSVLEANSALVFGKKKMRDTVKDSYDLSVLNTTIPGSELVEMVENAALDKEQHPDDPEGIRMLFYGLSGTGKTELARYISERLGKKLKLVRASDILGKYVGENEQKIKKAFEEAEETDAILLFDEADSFFADRAGANTSWERTMVNEFLTQMEEFSGILICTTNLRKIMDPAMQRRFHILTEFKALNEQGIETLLGSFFGQYKFEDAQVSSLAKYDTVTPGDFGSLKSKLRFVSKDKISSDYIIGEMLNIQKEKLCNGSGKIGFVS